MITPVDFAFVSAKLHGMRSKLYEGSRLEVLTTLRNAFEMMAAVFPSLDVRSRMRFEQVLVEEHVRDLNRVRGFLDGSNRAFFDWQLERYRVENLKVVLRAWKTRMPLEDLMPLLVQLPADYGLPVAEIMRTSKINDIIRMMPSRPYAAGIRRGIVQFHDTNKLFYIEAGLDAAFYEALCARAEDLAGTDRDEVIELLRMELLVYNVLFVLRSRLNYGVDVQDIREFLAAKTNIAPARAEMDAMLRAEDFDAMAAAMPHRRLLLGVEDAPGTIGELQRRMWERLYLAANRLFYRSTFHMGCVEAFYYIKRVEMMNLVRTAELLRQEVTGSEVFRELIRLSER